MVGGNHAHLVAHSRTENYHPERSYSRSAAEILFFSPDESERLALAGTCRCK